MHALGPDQLHGYAERLVGDHGPNYHGGGGCRPRRPFWDRGPARVSLEKSGAGQSAYQVHDKDVTAATVDYLNRLGVQKWEGLLDTPFSISVGFMLPHQPFVARQEDYQLYEGRMPMPKILSRFQRCCTPTSDGGVKSVGLLRSPMRRLSAHARVLGVSHTDGT